MVRPQALIGSSKEFIPAPIWPIDFCCPRVVILRIRPSPPIGNWIAHAGQRATQQARRQSARDGMTLDLTMTAMPGERFLASRRRRVPLVTNLMVMTKLAGPFGYIAQLIDARVKAGPSALHDNQPERAGPSKVIIILTASALGLHPVYILPKGWIQSSGRFCQYNRQGKS